MRGKWLRLSYALPVVCIAFVIHGEFLTYVLHARDCPYPDVRGSSDYRDDRDNRTTSTRETHKPHLCVPDRDGVYAQPGWMSRDSSKARRCAKLLVFADTQLQGYRGETHALGSITRWDAARHISAFVNAVAAFAPPDVAILAGDTLDEGAIASASEFAEYTVTLGRALLPLDAHCTAAGASLIPGEDASRTVLRSGCIPLIVLGGDNDVGGEGRDAMTDSLWDRFASRFGPPNAWVPVERFHEAREVHASTTAPVAVTKLETVSQLCASSDCFRRRSATAAFVSAASADVSTSPSDHDAGHVPAVVAVSHVPFRAASPVLVDAIVSSLRPVVAFAGHDHVARCDVVSGPNRGTPTGGSRVGLDSGGLSFAQFVLAPASYRMGTRHVGYGVATVCDDGAYAFRHCTLPSRFPHLAGYAVLIAAVTWYVCWRRQAMGRGKKSRQEVLYL